MKYFVKLPDGRLRLISRSTFWRFQKTSGFVHDLLDDDGRLIGRCFVKEV